MSNAGSDIAISNPALEQMRQVIIDSYSTTELEKVFRKAIQASQHPSLETAVQAWLERQLVYRNEELLEDVFRFFMTSLVQDLGRATQH